MAIFLHAPSHDPRGPDGRGHNRIEIQGITHDQCALRPRSYGTLVESRDTRRARWGGFAPCANEKPGSCDQCPILRARHRKLDVFGDTVLVRIAENRRPGGLLSDIVTTTPWVMNRPEGGWGSYGEPWTWEQLSLVDGWDIGQAYRDQHGEGFWLNRTAVPA